jgi:hypothetical protein
MEKRAGGMTQVIEYLISKRGVLNSNSSATKKKKKTQINNKSNNPKRKWTKDMKKHFI